MIGYSAERLREWFGDVQQVATLRNDDAVPNELLDAPIHICRQPRLSFPDFWAQLRHFN